MARTDLTLGIWFLTECPAAATASTTLTTFISNAQLEMSYDESNFRRPCMDPLNRSRPLAICQPPGALGRTYVTSACVAAGHCHLSNTINQPTKNIKRTMLHDIFSAIRYDDFCINSSPTRVQIQDATVSHDCVVVPFWEDGCPESFRKS